MGATDGLARSEGMQGGAYVSEAECRKREAAAWSLGWAAGYKLDGWNPFRDSVPLTPTVCTLCGSSPAEGHMCGRRNG